MLPSIMKIEVALFNNIYKLVLFLPLFYGIGIFLYISFPLDIKWYVLIVLIAALSLLSWLCRRNIAFFLSISLLAIVLGYSVIAYRSHSVSAPVLYKPFNRFTVEGIVFENRMLPSAQRIVIRDMTAAEKWKWFPRRVRVKINGLKDDIRVGDVVRVRANLMPPSPPLYPGTYDFSMKAWFEGIGAVGYNIGTVQILSYDKSRSLGDRFVFFMEEVRRNISLRLRDTLEGDTARVAMSLVTGEQHSVSQKMIQDYRDSGTVHILSVSGLHMSALGFMVFAFVRRVLVLFPKVALRYDIKKMSAVVALLVTFLYLMISGYAVAAQRAFIMVVAAFIAILIDRRSISLRSVAIAALIILTMTPENLFNPGFQMSFAAVAALIALYEFYSNPERKEKKGYFSMVRIYFYGVVISAIIGTLSTAVFSIYHFNRFPLYSVLGNLMVASIFSFLVMPLLLVSVLLMPLGLERYPLIAAGYGIDIANSFISFTASLPHAVLMAPIIPSWTVIFFVIGGYLFILLSGRMRYFMLLSVIPLFFALAFYKRPDFVINADGSLVAVKDDGMLVLSPGRGNRMERKHWLAVNAQEYDAENRKRSKEYFGKICGEKGLCLYESKDFMFEFSIDKSLKEKYLNVYKAGVLFKSFTAKDLKSNGVTVVRINDGGIRETTVKGTRARHWGK